MCGIVGFLDKTGRESASTGRIVLTMLEALGCRGPDSAGIAVIGEPHADGAWNLRIAPAAWAAEALNHLAKLGAFSPASRTCGDEAADTAFVVPCVEGDSVHIAFHPRPGVTPDQIERTLGARRGGLEVLCIGRGLDLIKQVGSPAQLEGTYHVGEWHGTLAIGHTRMSTESRIDLSHSQPFWAHGVLDLATVHNGHVTNYHRLRRMYEQRGVTFFTDNDSEVIGVYLRDRLDQGRSLAEAMEDSLEDLDGAFNYLVASSEGLGVVRDRFGFKPLVIAETDNFLAVATEEVALRRALPGPFRITEPPPGRAHFFRLDQSESALLASVAIG